MNRSKCILLFILSLLINESICTAREYSDDAPPMQSNLLYGYSEDRVKNYLDSADISPIEGIWHFHEDMLTLSIERFNDPSFSKRFKYRMVILEMEELSLSPGTIMGYIEETAQKDKYQLWIYCEQQDSRLFAPQKCAATFDESNSTLTFSKPEIQIKVRVNFAQFLPNLFRGFSIWGERKTEKLPLGFRRIYPSYDENESNISHKRYL
ncbi:MAG: hypothetical protein PHR45_07575 [Muribaculaceae bacterium]|nr:hypothetical protein [Muribaculaceae bacterium]